MNEIITHHSYSIMIMQVLVTLLFVPLLSFAKLKAIVNNYCIAAYPKAEAEVNNQLSSASKFYWLTVVILFLLAAGMVVQAMFNKSELLNWDNQSGLIILYLISMLPVILMVLIHKNLFQVIKKHAGSKRTASLKPRYLMSYLSKPLLAIIVLANIVFVLTVMYFVEHPFDGFAGYGNLVGMVALNALFAIITVVVFRDNKSLNYASPEHRDAFKRKAIHINLIILALALFHISLSIWVAGTELREYKLVTQSIYLQVVLILTAGNLTLPKAMFKNTTA